MSHIVMIKHRGTTVGFSRGSASEAVALALMLINDGESNVSITSPQGVVYESADFHLLTFTREQAVELALRRGNKDANGKATDAATNHGRGNGRGNAKAGAAGKTISSSGGNSELHPRE